MDNSVITPAEEAALNGMGIGVNKFMQPTTEVPGVLLDTDEVNYETFNTSLGNRIVSSYQLITVGSELRIKETQSHYSVGVVFDNQFLELAVVYDVSEHVKLGASYPAYPVPASLQVDETTNYKPLDDFNEALAAITYKVKGSEKTISRLDKVKSSLVELSIAHAELVAANTRLRTLQDTSPVPHGESNEMTLGSTAEISAQRHTISEIEIKMDKIVAVIEKNMTILNEYMPSASDDTGWVVKLPDVIAKVTAINPPLPEQMREELASRL